MSALLTLIRQISTLQCQLTSTFGVLACKNELSNYELLCKMCALLTCVLYALLTYKKLTKVELSTCKFSQTYKYVVLLCSLGVVLTYLKNKNVILNYKSAVLVLLNKYHRSLSNLRKPPSYLRISPSYMRVCQTAFQVCYDIRKYCSTDSQICANDLRVSPTNVKECSTVLRKFVYTRSCTSCKRNLNCPRNVAMGINFNLGRAFCVRSVIVSVVNNSRDLYIYLNAAFFYPLFSGTDNLRLTKSVFSFKFNFICLFIVINKLCCSINPMASRVETKCVQMLMNLVTNCYDAMGCLSSYLKFVKRMYLTIFFNCIECKGLYCKSITDENQNRCMIFVSCEKYSKWNKIKCFYAHNFLRHTSIYALVKFLSASLKKYSSNLSVELKSLSTIILKQSFLGNLNCLSVIFQIVLSYQPVIFYRYILNIIPMKFLNLSVIVMPYNIFKGDYDFFDLDLLLLLVIIHNLIYFNIFKTRHL